MVITYDVNGERRHWRVYEFYACWVTWEVRFDRYVNKLYFCLPSDNFFFYNTFQISVTNLISMKAIMNSSLPDLQDMATQQDDQTLSNLEQSCEPCKEPSVLTSCELVSIGQPE